MFRAERSDVVGVSLFELSAGAWDLPELRRAIARVLPERQPFQSLEIEREFAGIGRRTVLVSGRRINDMQLVLFVVDDITERKRSEEVLRRGEQRLRQVIDNDAVGVVFYDRSGRVLDANDKFLQMTGFERGDLATGVVDRDKLTPLAHRPITLEQLQKLDAVGRLGPYEKELVGKDGVQIWVMIAGGALSDGNVVEVCIDIESRKHAERTILEGDRRKDEFLATLAHELRNPLAPLTTALQVLRTAPADPARREQMYAMMERQLGQLVRLVDDLLDVARVSRGFIELRKELVDVASFARTALETCMPRIESMRRNLTVSLPNEALLVEGDAVRLGQVVVNLLNNAINYTNDGGHIWLTAQRDGDDACISVRDDGVGIAADMLPHVFEMFLQVDRQRTSGGLGIGLTLARSLVQLHGGTIEARSEGLGHGSEFIVRLPAKAGTSSRPTAGDDGAVSLAQSRVLVVDDNRDAADSLGMMLGAFGAEVEVAYDGQEALQRSLRLKPNVVLLDIGMPGMDGYEVARRFRLQPEITNCRLVAVTGWGQEADRARTAAAGFNLHLTKPIEINRLLDLLADQRPAKSAPAQPPPLPVADGKAAS
jgi:PAS domain S-box-containing protein